MEFSEDEAAIQKQRNLLSISCRLLPVPLLRKYEGKEISLFWVRALASSEARLAPTRTPMRT